MRLWSQARQMGAYAAQCMVANMGEDVFWIFIDLFIVVF